MGASVQKSFRLPENVVNQLAEISAKFHSGSQTDAIIAAIAKYHASTLVEPIGWMQVRFRGKRRCPGCNNEFEGPGFVTLLSSGEVLSKIHCQKCAK